MKQPTAKQNAVDIYGKDICKHKQTGAAARATRLLFLV
jgi:hypothetical protein